MIIASPFTRKFKPLLIFVLLGPLLGALPLTLLFVFSSILEQNMLGMGFMILLFSYPFGLFPATIAGTLFLLLMSYFQKNNIQLTRTYIFILGALCGLIGTLIFIFILKNNSIIEYKWKEAIWIIILGLIAGGFCGLLSKTK